MTEHSLLAARTALVRKYGRDEDRIERQIFLCALSEKQKCCSRPEGEAAWSFLKTRLKELGLIGPKREPDHPKAPVAFSAPKPIACKSVAPARWPSSGRTASGTIPAAPTCSNASFRNISLAESLSRNFASSRLHEAGLQAGRPSTFLIALGPKLVAIGEPVIDRSIMTGAV